MMPVAEAQARINGRMKPVSTEWLPLDLALDRVLAQPLVARRTQPPGTVSAMDGYAVRAGDLEAGQWCEVAGQNRAGAAGLAHLPPGTAARIFTGALLPDGADAIAIQENAERDGLRVRFTRLPRAGEFVRRAGLDFTTGWTGLQPGQVLGPRELGLAAAMGHALVPVRRRPRIAVLATGDEVKRPGEPLGEGDVLSSNATVLCALLRRWGAEPVDLGVAGDREEDLHGALAQAERCDMLITSGGASVGEHDLVATSLGQKGLALDFWKIAMRPGKPMMFGVLGDAAMLGLPGNPVSATVCAILFLRGAVRRLLDLDPALPVRLAVTAGDLPENDEREDYLRARFEGTGPSGLPFARRAERQDSSMFAVMASSDCLIIRAPLAPALSAGAEVSVVDLAAAGA